VASAAAVLAIAGVVIGGVPVSASRFTYVFPVVGHSGYAHKHHGYPASDIIADCGLPVVSPVDGVVLELSRVDLWDPKVNDGSTRGGKFVSIKGVDGVRYYGSHMSKVSKAIKPGSQVTAGQKIGEVGRTGRAGACHLHFGISPICAGTGDWWIRRGVVWRWPYLDTWKTKDPADDRSPRREVREWQQANGCPTRN
jgi:murein DD-endopeptidase MepM/ murein hydrolase activator NlpD